jgi:hypothetical protein
VEPLTGGFIGPGTAARRLLDLQADEPLPADEAAPAPEESDPEAFVPESSIPLAAAPLESSGDIALAPSAFDEPLGVAASPIAAAEPTGDAISRDATSAGFGPQESSGLPPIWAPPCPVAEVQAGNVTFRSDSLLAGTHEFSFLAIATSPGAFVAEPRVDFEPFLICCGFLSYHLRPPTSDNPPQKLVLCGTALQACVGGEPMQ